MFYLYNNIWLHYFYLQRKCYLLVASKLVISYAPKLVPIFHYRNKTQIQMFYFLSIIDGPEIPIIWFYLLKRSVKSPLMHVDNLFVCNWHEHLQLVNVKTQAHRKKYKTFLMMVNLLYSGNKTHFFCTNRTWIVYGITDKVYFLGLYSFNRQTDNNKFYFKSVNCWLINAKK